MNSKIDSNPERRLESGQPTLEELESELDIEDVREQVNSLLELYGVEDYSDDLMTQLDLAMKLENHSETEDSSGLDRRGSYEGIQGFAKYLDYTSTAPRMDRI